MNPANSLPIPANLQNRRFKPAGCIKSPALMTVIIVYFDINMDFHSINNEGHVCSTEKTLEPKKLPSQDS